MVVKTIKASVPGVVAMVFNTPSSGEAGDLRILDQSRLHVLVPQFKGSGDLIKQLVEVREALTRKAKERRYVKIFQTQHMDVLQRCHKLKQAVDKRDGVDK
jgi:hypothetical protein